MLGQWEEDCGMENNGISLLPLLIHVITPLASGHNSISHNRLQGHFFLEGSRCYALVTDSFLVYFCFRYSGNFHPICERASIILYIKVPLSKILILKISMVVLFSGMQLHRAVAELHWKTSHYWIMSFPIISD